MRVWLEWNGMQTFKIEMPTHASQPLHEQPCTQTRNSHSISSTTHSHPLRATARSSSILAQESVTSRQTKASKWPQNLLCMPVHVHGSAVCNSLDHVNKKKITELLSRTVPPRLPYVYVHTTAFARCCLLTDDATPESGW
jgi:hypothetical protein